MSDTLIKNAPVQDGCAKKKIRCKSLIIHGAKYRTLLNKKYESRKKWEKPNPNHVISYIPGTIREVLVKEGQSVKKGDKLLILEAMKMMNSIEVPVDGRVKKIHVHSEKRVPKGFLMVEIE